jgi:hypothetical protein
MKIKVSLSVGDDVVKDDVIDIHDWKLEELTQEEIEESIEIQIRSWADRQIKIAWEVNNDKDKGETNS